MKTFYTLILAATMLLATGEAMAKKKPAKKKHKHTISHVHHRVHHNVRMTKGGLVKHTTIVTGTDIKPSGSVQTGTIHHNARATTGGVQKRSSN